MTHIPDHELLMEADGELGAVRAREVRTHLAGCPECHSRRAEIEQALALAIDDHLEMELPPIDGARSLLQTRMRPPGGQRYRTAAALAAALLLMLLPFLPERNGDHTPRAALTPGAVRAVGTETVCAVGGTEARPAIPSGLAMEIFHAYGIQDPQPRAYEIDYLIPPDLGGAGEARNLWPQPYNSGTWNARVKDALEDRLQSMVCRGTLDLPTAQREIAADWVGAYRKYFQTSEPLPDHLAFRKDQPWE